MEFVRFDIEYRRLFVVDPDDQAGGLPQLKRDITVVIAEMHGKK
jgi:hypothetical protein